MARQQSKGTCSFCNNTFSKSGMSRHLGACEQRKVAPEKPSGDGKATTARTFHLQVEGSYLPQYWMHVEVPAQAILVDLDDFLRKIWLECCGHLSAFRIEGTMYFSHLFQDVGDPDDKDMLFLLSDVLKPDMKLDYEYDFGTTTDLTLKVVSEREGNVRGKSIQILARNDPPSTPCESCGKTATQVCALCSWSAEGWVCDECGSKHECGEEMLLPVVNSPRVGQCGYTGEIW